LTNALSEVTCNGAGVPTWLCRRFGRRGQVPPLASQTAPGSQWLGCSVCGTRCQAGNDPDLLKKKKGGREKYTNTMSSTTQSNLNQG